MQKFIQFLSLILVIAINSNAKNINKPISSQYGFIENKGQIIDQNNNPNPSVLYLYNGNGLRVQLRKEGFSYEVINTIKTPKTKIDKVPYGKFYSEADSFDITCQTHRVDINFKDGNKNATLKPFQPASDFINYYTTGTSEAGVTNVHHYQKIVYENVYPNIDIEFVLNDAANRRKFKYNFIVKPNGNLTDIKLAFLGANRTSLNQAGNILIETAYGNIEENIPLSYVITNNNSHSSIKANFTALDNNIYGINAENYNHNQTLVIDPTNWATYFGGNGIDIVNKITTDKSGNVLITGYTNSINSIATIGSYQIANGGIKDAFIAKFNTSGIILWATYYGGSNDDIGNGITTDTSGSIIIIGQTPSTSSIATTGVHQAIYGGGSTDAFIAKFTTNGIRQWATYYGGSSTEYGNAITTDAIGNILITGITYSSNAISTSGAHQISKNGNNWDVFVVKFNTNGIRQWATYYGGSGNDNISEIATDASRNIIIIGSTYSTTAIVSTGSYQTTYGGGIYDVFIAKFNTNGIRQWATYYGGSGEDNGCGIATDSVENIIVTGYTSSINAISTMGVQQIIYGGGIYDAFIAKFNSNGVLQWASYYGDSEEDRGYDVVSVGNGNVMITGYTASTNGMVTIGTHQTIYGGGSFDIFLAKFNTNGIRQWATYYGGGGDDLGTDIAKDTIGNIIISGYTSSINSIATTGAYQTTIAGSAEIFIAKFKPNGQLNEVKNIIKGNQNICENTIPNQILDSVSISNFSYTYNWIRSTIGPDTGFVNLNIDSANYTPPTLFYTTWYKRIITSLGIVDTSNVIQVTVDNTKTWLGTTSNAWGVASNWSCNLIPVFSSNVFINSGSPNMPIISDSGRVANNITILNGASLTINSTNSNLTIFGAFINDGQFTNTNGIVSFSGSSPQLIPTASYSRLRINNSSGVSCSGNIDISDSLILTNGCISISNNNLTLIGTDSKIIGADSTKFIITNGTGLLKIQNVGTTLRTSTILFPIGTALSSYTPVSILNTGTADTFSIRVINGIYQSYLGSIPTGSAINSNVVNRTWFINEGIVGGSNANITLQWSANEEFPSMDNTACYISFYNALGWNNSTTGVAIGSNPYTKSRNGLTTFSNTAFGVGSNGTLPIKLLSFNATLANEKVNCTWETASETNNDYFTLERSKDGNSFEAVGNVKGQGNSNSNTRYSYMDNNPFSGISYYRLRQTDFDGKYAYSPIKKVGSTEKTATEISLYYENNNPIVKINSLVESNANMELINLNGIKLFTYEQPIIKGENTFAIDGNTTKGLYLLKVQVEDEVKYFKVWLK